MTRMLPSRFRPPPARPLETGACPDGSAKGVQRRGSRRSPGAEPAHDRDGRQKHRGGCQRIGRTAGTGPGCAPGQPNGSPGPSTTERCPPSRAPSSARRGEAAQCGVEQAGLAVVGAHRRLRPTRTAAGSPSSAVSAWSTPSACSGGPSAGPTHGSATRMRPIAGPGSSSPPMPGSGSPAHSLSKSGAPGGSRPSRTSSRRPASAGGFRNLRAKTGSQPVRQNPPTRGPGYGRLIHPGALGRYATS